MAEFCKEFLEENDWIDLIPDFSILEEFKRLNEGDQITIICEGYGFTGISKEDGLCILMKIRKSLR